MTNAKSTATAQGKQRTKPTRATRNIKKRMARLVVVDDQHRTAAYRNVAKAHPGLLRRDGPGLLAASIGMPGHAKAFRMPTVDAPRSSICTTRDQFSVVVGNSTPTGWANGDSLYAYYGQPGRMLTYWTALSTGAYSVRFAGQNESVATSWQVTAGLIANLNNQTVVIAKSWPVAACVSGQAHGTILSAGYSGSDSYVFLNVGDAILINGGNYTGAGVGVLGGVVSAWTGPGSDSLRVADWTVQCTGNTLTATTLYTATFAGYFCVTVEELIVLSTPVTAVNITDMRIGNNAVFGWKQLGLSDIDATAGGDILLAQDCRLNAAALLITNTTAEVNKQGTVIAARVRNLEFTSMTPTLLSRAAEKYVGQASQGVYTFKEYSETMSRFSNCSETTYPTFDLDSDDFYHFIQISCPTPTTMANSYVVSYMSTVEFKCDSSRYMKETAEYPYEDLIAARLIINSNPEWFYENPLHAAQIYGWIKSALGKAGKFAKDHAAPLALLASSVNPANAAIYGGLSGLSKLL